MTVEVVQVLQILLAVVTHTQIKLLIKIISAAYLV